MIAWPLTFWPTRFWPQGFWPDDASRHEVLARTDRNDPATQTLLAAVLPDEDAEYTFTGSPSSEAWLHVTAYNKCNVPDPGPIGARQQRIAFDVDGALILPVPNPPLGLRLTLGAGGAVVATWAYSNHLEPAAVAQFNVYVAEDADPFDYDTPSFTVAASGGRTYSQALGTFDDGTTVRVVVRCEAASGAEETNTDEVTAVADAVAPDAPTAVTVEVA